MISFTRISTVVGLIAFYLSGTIVEGSPYVISDDRVRSLDTTPLLGRGYSIMTNSFQSTCLMVDETSVPSYNYDYTYYDFTQVTDYETELAGSLSSSIGYYWVRNTIRKSTFSTAAKVSTYRYYVVAVMRIERYYSSVKEEMSPLSEDATALLSSQDYIGFFKACGPNYVRSIRRAQEVTVIFSFESSSAQIARQYAQDLKASGWGASVDASFNAKSKYRSISQSLHIDIKGYGLGLNHEGAETLVATSLAEFNNVMKFAFRVMTQNQDSFHIGMVYGIEVVPWVDNPSFQVASQIHDETLQIPLARSLIPKAYRIDGTTTAWSNDSATRTEFQCKERSYQIDKYGYCCEEGSLYDFALKEYDEENPETKVCRTVRSLEKSMIKANMAGNGEFVARLDSAVRYRQNQLSTLERCVSAAAAIPDRFDSHYLKSQDSVKYDASIDGKFTLKELKIAVDPFSDYSLVKHMGKELDEFLEMFYQPCIAALYGSNIGLASDVEPSYFSAYPWHTHEECLKLSCLGNSMRWDRKDGSTGGCVPSLISGIESAAYSDNEGDNSGCKSDIHDNDADEEKCKYDSTELKDHRDKTVDCWDKTIPRGRVDYFMEYYCMPQITNEKATDEIMTDINTKHDTYCGN